MYFYVNIFSSKGIFHYKVNHGQNNNNQDFCDLFINSFLFVA